MANEKNLIPGNKRSQSEARENGKKGGQKSGEVRRQKKKMKEIMNTILSLDIPDHEVKETFKKAGLENEDLNIQTAIVYKQVENALKGNLDSAKFCRDTAGEYIGAEEKEENERYKEIGRASCRERVL